MTSVPATEFCRNFGRWREAAQREPVAVTSHGRTMGYFVSAAEFEALRGSGIDTRRHHKTVDMDDAFWVELAAAEVDPKHAHLDALLDD